jgi:ABC-type transport system substrate-binding protein
LRELEHLPPLPLHVYATGQFAEVYNPRTGAYNSALARQLMTTASFNAAMLVDNGPFTVQSFDPGNGAVLVRNPHFFSNLLHKPALDRVTLIADMPQWPQRPPEPQWVNTLVTTYRQGGVDLVDGLSTHDLSRLGGIPKAQVIFTPSPNWVEVGFNQRAVAPNAQANGGVSIFSDLTVRKAFVEAFDRCAAIRAQLGISNCSDPNLRTDEMAVLPAPDYDPTVTLPGYNPADAARLMDQAGYPVVDGVRRAKDGHTPLRLTIGISPGGAQFPLVAQRMKQDYTRNLKIAVILVSPPDFFAAFADGGIALRGNFDIWLVGDNGDFDPQLSAELSILASTDATDVPSVQNPLGGNLLGIDDPLVGQQKQLGSQTPDPDQRAAVYRELQRHFALQFYAEPVFILADVALAKPTLCNYKQSPVFPGKLWNIADWYVASSCP